VALSQPAEDDAPIDRAKGLHGAAALACTGQSVQPRCQPRFGSGKGREGEAPLGAPGRQREDQLATLDQDLDRGVD